MYEGDGEGSLGDDNIQGKRMKYIVNAREGLCRKQ